MNRTSLKLSSIILFYLLALLALTITVDAQHGPGKKCRTVRTTTTTTVTKTALLCPYTPPPKLSCPDCRGKYGNNCRQDGHGHHCKVTATCTLTKTVCVPPKPVCLPNGASCTYGQAPYCCNECCPEVNNQLVGTCFTRTSPNDCQTTPPV